MEVVMAGGRLGLELVARTDRDCVRVFVSWEEDDIKAKIRLREVIDETRKLAGESKERIS